MHKLELEIIQTLAKHGKTNFNNLKTREVDPKLFAYHLEILQNEGYIVKESDGLYQFTSKGLHYLSSLEAGLSFTSSSVNTYIVVALKQKDRYLVVKRSKAPFLDYVGFLFTPIEKAKNALDSARELLNRESLIVANLHISTILDVLYKDAVSTETNLHSLIIVVTGDLKSEIIEKSIEEGACYMLTKDELLAQEKGYSNTRDIIDKAFDLDQLQYISRTYTDNL